MKVMITVLFLLKESLIDNALVICVGRVQAYTQNKIKNYEIHTRYQDKYKKMKVFFFIEIIKKTYESRSSLERGKT